MTERQKPELKQTAEKWYRFIFARRINELNQKGQKFLFCLWNLSALLLSSVALCAVSLNFAIGRYENLFYIYLGYLRTPEIFLLNWLPLLLMQLFLYAVCNRQWLAFLISGTVAMLMSIGNYFKLIFRSDPFTFSDLTSIRAGLAVAGDYDVRIDWRILLAFFFMVAAVLILFFFARARQNTGKRILTTVLVVLAAWQLWDHVYSDSTRYYENSYKNFLFVTRDSRDSYIANGFYYPFIFSITESSSVPPENYDEAEISAVYNSYSSQPIPEREKLNLMVIQLESFADLEAAGFEGISDGVYAPLRTLQAESVSGTMIASVIGGGTVVTERAVLTGSYMAQDTYHPAYSYVRYLRSQGFTCTASHPNVSSFYTRGAINEYLGFEVGRYLDNYFQDLTGGEWRCDAVYLPEIFRLFREDIAVGNPVFSFNVSLQGHGPYNDQSYDREDDLWTGAGVSETTRCALNNYLSLVKETQIILAEQLEEVRQDPEPMVFLIFGDHKPLFSDEVYQELGITTSMEDGQGMEDYLGTPYLIWANEAAKQLSGNEFSGNGPTTSPGYLMNLLFNQLGWEGPAFMQYTENVRQTISVICTKGGYIEDGIYCQALSAEGNTILKQYRDLLYYLHYRPELAEKLP